MHLPEFLRFASDATIVAIAAMGLLALSAVATWGEARRRRRADIDAVGVMPWRDIAALTTFAGLVLLAVAILGWIKG